MEDKDGKYQQFIDAKLVELGTSCEDWEPFIDAKEITDSRYAGIDQAEVDRIECRKDTDIIDKVCWLCANPYKDRCWDFDEPLLYCPRCSQTLTQLKIIDKGVTLDFIWQCLNRNCKKKSKDDPFFYGYTQEDMSNNLRINEK